MPNPPPEEYGMICSLCTFNYARMYINAIPQTDETRKAGGGREEANVHGIQSTGRSRAEFSVGTTRNAPNLLGKHRQPFHDSRQLVTIRERFSTASR